MGESVAQSATKLTYDDLVLFPEDGKRHELIEGEHFVTPSPNVRHQEIGQNVFRILDGFVRERRLGKVFGFPVDVVLTRHDVVVPDVQFLSKDRLEILTAANLGGPPDLAVEILSPSGRRRDEVLKRDLYERAGVAEYWLVDPEAEAVKVFARDGGRYGRPRLLALRESDVLSTPLLPGLEIPLAAVFAE